MTHTELLAEAERLHVDLAVHAEELEQKVTAQAEEIAALKTQISALEAEIVRLKQRIAELEAQIPQQNWLWNDDFSSKPTDAKYVRAGADPDQNFLLVPGGGMDCVFVTGKTGGPFASAETGKVLRSELMIRIPGTNNHWRADIGKDYVEEFAFTLPANFAPAAGNETNLVNQYWQDQSVKPPIQLQLIDPATTPDPLILRIVLTAPAFGSIPAKNEVKPWKIPIQKGTKYEVYLRTRWAFDNTGLIVLKINGQDQYLQQSAPTCFDLGQGMAPHLGQYQPGSHDEVAGVKTTVRFHYWRIRLAS